VAGTQLVILGARLVILSALFVILGARLVILGALPVILRPLLSSCAPSCHPEPPPVILSLSKDLGFVHGLRSLDRLGMTTPSSG
jgi:hypothetical protein